MNLVAKIVASAMLSAAMLYAGLVLYFEWHDRVEDRALYAQFSSQANGIQVIASGWDNSTLEVFFPGQDQSGCDAFVDGVEYDTLLLAQLHQLGFRHLACMQAKADLR